MNHLDKERSTAVRSALWLGLLTSLFVATASLAAPLETSETLFMRDGSVLKGVVVADPSGTMLVYTTYGSLTVDAGDVLFRMAPIQSQPGVSEVYVLGAPDDRAIATFLRAVPDADAEATTFTLLIPGRILAVHDIADRPVAYTCQQAGSVTQLVVRYSDLPGRTGAISVTAQVDDVVSRNADGGIEFRQGYTLDRDGRMRLVVKYPAEWSLESVFPRPTMQLDGLLAWDQQLRRQSSCSPTAVFATHNASLPPADSDTTGPADSRTTR